MTRASRLGFGMVMIVGALILVDNALGDGHPRFGHLYPPPRGQTQWHAWQLITGTWIVATMTAFVGLLIPDRGNRFRVASYVVPSMGVALMAGARAKALVEGREPLSVHTLYGVTVAMSCVPGLLVVLPVIVTAMTGIPILPLLYLMDRWAVRARHEGELPVAVARIAS